MGFLRSLFQKKSRSCDDIKFAEVMSAYIRSINMSFRALDDPLEKQIRNPQKRRLVLCFLLGSADFLGQHTKISEESVFDCFALALEMGLDLSSGQAQKACTNAAEWSAHHDGRLYMQQGAKAFAEFMNRNAFAPSKKLRDMLYFSDPTELLHLLENGADLE